MGQIFLNPITYVALILVALQYRRQVELERAFFGVRIHSVPMQFVRSIGYGILSGLISSIFVVVLGITLQYTDMIIVWGISLILMMFRVRFLCVAYAGGITAVLAFIATLYPNLESIPYVSWIWGPLQNINIASLTALIAILHLVEALLVRIHTSANSTPVFIEGKRGKIIGAYEMKTIWFVPLVVLAPGSENLWFNLPSWLHLFGTAAGISLLTIPVITGFSTLAVTRSVKETTASSTKGMILYGVVLLGLAVLARFYPLLAILPAIFAIVGHEAITAIGRWKERKGQPIFINDERGMMILSILPGTPADEMGLKPGEIVSKVNGITVNTKSEFYEALQKQSGAFCKLEVINLEGHVKFATRAIYDGQHHQLGIISAPDGYINYYLRKEDISVTDLIVPRIEYYKASRKLPNSTNKSASM